MSIIDRIKHLKPKQWAMIVGGVGVVGLGYDYYRRREGSIVGRALERIHPSSPPPPPLPPPSQQRRPAAPSMPGMPDMGDMGDMGMAQLPMGGEVIVEEPGFYAPYYGGWPWRGYAWPHGFDPRHEFHGAHPSGPHMQPHPAQHGAPQQHGAPPQQPQQQQQHGPPPPSGHHH